MTTWNLTPPPTSELHDHDVPVAGVRLRGKRIALLVTGGIAAMKAPFLARGLRRHGATVTAFASEEALRYTTVDALEWSTTRPVVTRLGAAAEHLSDAEPFDAYLVAPATYNTINAFRQGIAHNAITSTLASALGRLERGQTRILLAPTMHGTMHNAILTESLRALTALGVDVIPPREDYGKHNLPDTRAIVAAVCRATSTSPVRGVPILVTAGPTPVPIDGVRRITNRFRGRLGIAISDELHLRGADVLHIQGDGARLPEPYVPCRVARTYDDYRELVTAALAEKRYAAGVFSAAVADYRPREAAVGKIASGRDRLPIELVPTVKVIDEVRERYPDLKMISFKYQERITHDALMAIARERLGRGHSAVVANRGEETGPAGEQIAYLLRRGAEPQQLVGKTAIAVAIADQLEALMASSSAARSASSS
jgi:phosphopantothenoylcysteine decarboxylase / phosphopantothenate---cysteine ligase